MSVSADHAPSLLEGSGAGSARPHRLRLPPAMGERKLAREAIALAPESFDL